MDSLTQLVLGAAVGVAVMRRRTAVWKAALWGGVAGTLPDLDVLWSHGDPILDMVLHRAETHAPFWLTLFSLPFAAAVARLHGEWASWRRWWLALWLALVTHPLLDALTVYGTQLALPFSNHPYGQASVFIIDPTVTLPWLVGVVWALASRGSALGHKANLYGLAAGVAVLAAGVALQGQVERHARASLVAQGIAPQRVLVVPAGFSLLLWRVVAVDADRHHEGFHGLLDPDTGASPMRFDSFDRGARYEGAVAGIDGAQRIRRFSKGFYKLHERDGQLVISDLRMGQEPGYVFAFAVAERGPDWRALPVSVAVGGRGDAGQALAWWWRRQWGEVLPPPR
jgi:inner membrane protein